MKIQKFHLKLKLPRATNINIQEGQFNLKINKLRDALISDTIY